MIPFSILNAADGDIDLSKGGVQFTPDLKTYVVQRLDENLSFFYGEWFLDLRKGIPYFEKIIGAKPDLGLIETLYRRAIFLTPGVGSLPNLRLTFDRPTRKLGVFFTATTKDGTLITQDDLSRKFIVNF